MHVQCSACKCSEGKRDSAHMHQVSTALTRARIQRSCSLEAAACHAYQRAVLIASMHRPHHHGWAGCIAHIIMDGQDASPTSSWMGRMHRPHHHGWAGCIAHIIMDGQDASPTSSWMGRMHHPHHHGWAGCIAHIIMDGQDASPTSSWMGRMHRPHHHGWAGCMARSWLQLRILLMSALA
jgi:hypothetical protein